MVNKGNFSHLCRDRKMRGLDQVAVCGLLPFQLTPHWKLAVGVESRSHICYSDKWWVQSLSVPPHPHPCRYLLRSFLGAHGSFYSPLFCNTDMLSNVWRSTNYWIIFSQPQISSTFPPQAFLNPKQVTLFLRLLWRLPSDPPSLSLETVTPLPLREEHKWSRVCTWVEHN